MLIEQIQNKVKRRLRIKERYEHYVLNQVLSLFAGKKGIEIGGPSLLFSHELPIYTAIKGLDGCNFSNSTIWEGSIKEGPGYTYFQDKTGYQFINEASDLNRIGSNAYDFLLSSHCLEHCANPVKALQEWLRIIKPGGFILLVLPKKEYTFDHKRPVTSFEHLQTDFKNNVDESDLTHLDEILELHDLDLDPAAGDMEAFRSRSLQNFNNRCLHHHVFDSRLLKQLFSYLGIKVKREMFIPPFHQVIVGRKR